MTNIGTYGQQTLSNLGALAQRAGTRITSAIQKASNTTGVGFDYLLKQAHVESSFKADAKARTSSATGLYQFIESTWMDMVGKYGDKYGVKGGSRAEILSLRKDPEISSYMAAEFAAENRRFLASSTGKSEADISSTELYMAHFLGAGGASNFLQAMKKTPYAPAADIMPAAARANRNVFYDEAGRARSLAQVFERFEKKFGDAPATSGQTQYAQAAPKARAGAINRVDTAAATRSVLEVQRADDDNTVVARARRQVPHTANLKSTYAYQPSVIPTGVSRSFFLAPEQVSVLSVADTSTLAGYRRMRSSYNS